MSDFFITDENPVQISEPAIIRLKKIIENDQPEGKKLRIGVKGGGCSGLSYILDFDTPNENDDEYSIEGVSFIMDRRHRLYMDGTILDFSDGLDNRGFEFKNPNASETCGCGSSFSA